MKRTPDRDIIEAGHGGQAGPGVCCLFGGHQIGTELCQGTGSRPGRGGLFAEEDTRSGQNCARKSGPRLPRGFVVCVRGQQIETELC